MVKEIWIRAYEETHDPITADEAVFRAHPQLKEFTRYARRGEGPPGDTWLGLSVVVVNPHPVHEDADPTSGQQSG